MVIANNLVSNNLKSSFYQSDLDLDPMKLILKRYLDIKKMSRDTNN